MRPFWKWVWFGISAITMLDFLVWIFGGESIPQMLGGTSSPLVAAIAGQIMGMDPSTFIIVNVAAVFVAVYLVYVCYRHEVRS